MLLICTVSVPVLMNYIVKRGMNMKEQTLNDLRRKAVTFALVSGLFCGGSGMVYAAEEATETEKSQLLNYLSERGQPGDYNGDGVINVFDLMRYKNSFIEEKGFYSTGESAIDVNGDGAVDGVDITAVKNDILKQSKIWAYKSVPKMDGSTSAIPLEAGFKSKMLGVPYSDAKMLVSHHKTHESFSMLLSGENDMIFTVPISEEQKKAADDAGVKLNFVPVAKEGFVFVVNKNNPVDSLTSEQIRDIYSGKITNWKEVGGNDAKIIPYQRNKDSGSQNYMTEFMKGYDLMDPPKTFVLGLMSTLMDGIAVYDNAVNAIGYSVYSYAAQMYENSSDTKFIAVDGIKPTRETMADGSYPLLSSTSIVYTDKASQNTKEFAAWAVSEEGQKTVLSSGYVPVKDMEYPEEYLPYYAKGTGKEKPADYKPSEKYSRLIWTFSWDDGMPDGDVQIFWLKNKELEKKINADVHKTVFGDKACIIPGKWQMYVEVFNGIMNMSLKKDEEYNNYNTHTLKDVYTFNYDLKSGSKIEKFSDLFYKDVDFVPEVSSRTADILASECSKDIKTDYIGLMGKMDNFSFDTIFIEKEGPYFDTDISVPFLEYWNDMSLIDSMITGEYFDCRTLLEDGAEERFDYLHISEGTYPEWEKKFKYDENGELRFDYNSRFHTAEEIKERNMTLEQIYEKYAADVKEPHVPVGRNNVHVYTPDETSDSFELNAYLLFCGMGSIEKIHQYWYDPETKERIHLSDIFGKEFEKYDNHEDFVLEKVDYNNGVVKIYDKKTDKDVLVDIDFEKLNQKYIKPKKATITERKWQKNAVVIRGNDGVVNTYPESYVADYGPEEILSTVKEDTKVKVTNSCISHGSLWCECRDDDNYYGWIPSGNIGPDLEAEEYDFYEKHHFLFLDEHPLNFGLRGDNEGTPVYSDEYISEIPDSTETGIVNSLTGYCSLIARTKCQSHGKWWYECWNEDDGIYYGWISDNDLDYNYQQAAPFNKKYIPIELPEPKEFTLMGKSFGGAYGYDDSFIKDYLKTNPFTTITEDFEVTATECCYSHGEQWYRLEAAGTPDGYCWVNACYLK